MVRLSVNINKIATLRNSRGGDVPNVVQVAKDAERFGAQGITVHPRPDERHIRYADVYDLKNAVSAEFNIEGYPSTDFMKMVLEVRPEQVTLVPDPPGALTSNAGWDAKKNFDFLTEVVAEFKKQGIRTSIFMETELNQIEWVAKTGADRIELYTEGYATDYSKNKEDAIAPYKRAALKARECSLGLNAGHDLSLQNLKYFAEEVEGLNEVSIGHALIADALYYGLENTIQLYLRELRHGA